MSAVCWDMYDVYNFFLLRQFVPTKLMGFMQLVLCLTIVETM